MKTEWGAKRVCPECGAAFYDLRRVPVVCPKCGGRFEPEVFTKVRRGRVQPLPEEKKLVIAPAPEETIPAEERPEESEEFEELEEEEGAASEEEDVPEDASELGEDDDVAKVVDKVDEDEKP